MENARESLQRWQREGKDYVVCGLNCSVELKCTNVLCSTRLGCNLSLRTLAKTLTNAVYDPKKMDCIIWRHRHIGGGRSTALLFKSGYVSVNGNRTVLEARRNLRQFARKLQLIVPELTVRSINIQAVSASCRVGENRKFSMTQVHECFGGSFEPELLQAACFKRHGVSFIVFPSGSIVITGIRNSSTSMKKVRETVMELVMFCSSS